MLENGVRYIDEDNFPTFILYYERTDFHITVRYSDV